MTAGLYASSYGKVVANGKFAAMVNIGDAFRLNCNESLFYNHSFYDANVVFVPDAVSI